MSIARRMFPSRLELKSFLGSGMEAPRAKVSFTTCLYDSPVQTMPPWDQTGVPGDAGLRPFPLLLDAWVGFVDKLTDKSESLSSPIPQLMNPCGDFRGTCNVRSGGLDLRATSSLHVPFDAWFR